MNLTIRVVLTCFLLSLCLFYFFIYDVCIAKKGYDLFVLLVIKVIMCKYVLQKVG